MSEFRSLSQQDLAAGLKKYNPWWRQQRSYTSWLKKRVFFKDFKALVFNKKIQRAIVLLGPRRIGKTVMLHQLISHALKTGQFSSNNILFVSIDDPIYHNQSLEQIIDLFKTSVKPRAQAKKLVIFDEVQYLKNWEYHLKVLVDKYPNIKFIASGSSAAALKRQSMESGAGRFTDFFLPPLTFKEFIIFSGRIDCKKNIKKLNAAFIDYINFGGYPEPIFNKEIQKNIKKFIGRDIVDKILLKDLPNLYGIQDIQELNNLLTMTAFNSGQEINLEDLSKRSGIAKNTIQKYLQYLESAFLIKKVYRIDDSARRLKRARHFKVYLTNPSMYSALFGEIKSTDAHIGRLIETAVFSQYVHSEYLLEHNVYYAKWKKNNIAFEVDLVQTNERYKPISLLEIKWSDRPYNHINELKGVIKLAEKHHLNHVHVASKTITKTVKHKNLKIIFKPCSILCCEIEKIF